MSNGGFLSYLLACEMSDRFTAIASVTGSMTLGLDDLCNCQDPMPVMQIHGTADPVVPFDGGGLYTPIDVVLDHWLAFNSISNPPEIYLYPDVVTTDGSTAERYLYENEETGVNFSLIKIIGGGHTWPGAAAPTEDTNYDIDASVEIWKFLSKHQREQEVLSNGSQTNTGTITYFYQDHLTEILRVEWKKGPTEFQVFNMGGQLVLNGHLSDGHQSIDLSTLIDGHYSLIAGDVAWRFVKQNSLSF